MDSHSKEEDYEEDGDVTVFYFQVRTHELIFRCWI